MFGKTSRTAGDYHELNAGAHRKPPKVLSAPSLVWHLAFWTNFHEDNDGKSLVNGDGTPRKKDSHQIKDALDNYIVALRDSIMINRHVKSPGSSLTTGGEGGIANGAAGIGDKVRLTPCISGKCLLFENAYDEKSLTPVRRDELRPRQADIFGGTNRTVTLQFVWEQLDVTIRFEVLTEYFTISTFVELDKERVKVQRKSNYSSIDPLNAIITDIVKYLNSVDLSADGDEREVRINQYCFHEFWEMYQRDILSGERLTDCATNTIFGHIFADFRGFVASDQAVKFTDEGFFKYDQYPLWGANAKAKLLPLIQHRNRAEHSRYECAANYMLDGRALYMSTLGPQIPSTPDDERIPVEFIVYVHQRYDNTTVVNKWQLGRLVSQILQLGTLCLCALKDVKLLHEAGQYLGSLEQNTQKAREAIASTETRASTSKENRGEAVEQDEFPVPSEVTVMGLIGSAHEKLNKITGNFLNATASGLQYRIERSRYYVQQFEENVKLLRIKRLEGDQPYDQFIRRRLGSEFDFIDRLGTRFERATSNVVSLDQNYLAITQNALVKQANRIDEDIHTIQEWGEFALLAALVPYYVMHLLDLIIKEKYVPVLTAGVWTVFGALALYRKFKSRTYVACFLAIAVVIVAAVALPPSSGSFFGGSILRVHETPERQLETQEEILRIHRNLEKLGERQLAILRELANLKKEPEQKRDSPPSDTPERSPKP